MPISIDEFADGLRADGLPEDEVAAFAELFAAVLDGRNAYLTDGVERVLGRPPRRLPRLRRSRRGHRGVGRRGDGGTDMTGGVTRLAAVAAVAAATNGGVFFAFSTFVMRALRDLEPRQGLIAMQSINRAAPNPLFMTLLFGTAVLSGGLAVVGLRNLDDPGAPGLVAGGVLYLVAVGDHGRLPRPAQRGPRPAGSQRPGVCPGLARLRLGVDDGEPPPHRRQRRRRRRPRVGRRPVS